MSNLSELLPAGGAAKEFEAVASGTLSSGQTVVLNSNGTVSAVAEINISESVGSKTTIEASETEDFGAAYDIANNKVVVSYADRANSDYGTYAVGSISGTSISFGTPGVFQSAATTNNSLVYDPDTGQIIFVSVSGGASGKSVVGTVSGASISFGTSATYEANPVYWLGATYVPDQQKVFIAYRRTNNNIGYGVVGTVSGTSISFGSPVQFSASRADHVKTTYAGSSKVVVVYEDFGNNQKGAAIVGTISGTSVSFGTQSFYSTAFPAQYNNIAYDPVNDKVLVIYYKDYGKGVVGTISGTSISFGSDFDFDQTNVVRYGLGIVYSALTGTFVIVYPDASGSNEGYYVQGTISGTDVSFTNPTQLTTTEFDWCVVTIDNTTAKPIVAWSDNSSGYATSLVIQLAYSTTNYTDFIGITQEAIANTATGLVTPQGGVNSSVTGLTIGADYYVQADGSLGSPTGYAPYNISGGVYDSVSLSVSDTGLNSIFLKPDGTKLYAIGYQNDTVYEYALSSAFDLSTASLNGNTKNISAQSGSIPSLVFKTDGTKMYALGSGSVFQYSLSTAWDVSTASYDSKSLTVSSQDSNSSGIWFKADGSKMYMCGFTNDSIFEYGLSTAWDVSTGSYASVSFDMSATSTQPRNMYFDSTGTILFLADTANPDKVFKFTLSSAWNITTISSAGSLDVSSQAAKAVGVTLSADGTKMYVADSENTNTVYQYSLFGATSSVSAGRALSTTSILLEG